MHFSTLLGLAASITSASAVSQGFNYGATFSDNTFRYQKDFEADFSRQKNLQGTSGFTSARLYTMIQGGTTDTPTEAIQAAINTKTRLLLGLWASAGSDVFNNEVNALSSAIKQYGSDFTSLIDGISVGSEDLYRVSPTGIENESGLGSTPDELAGYIKQVRNAIKNSPASGASIGHVDTWTAWVNGSNQAVIDNCDWLGMDTYPYFQTTVENSIENANQTFWDAYDATVGAAGGKEVWITETGWPVSGKTENLAEPSLKNAETYWKEVACVLLGNYNTWWFTLQDSAPTTPNPSFGIVGSDLQSEPLYDLSCKNHTSSHSSSASGTATKSASATGTKSAGGSNHGFGGGSGSASATGTAAPSGGSSGLPYPSGANGTAPGGYSASPTGPSGTGSPSSPSGSLSATPPAQTGNGATKAGSAAAAGVFAILALVAAL